MIKTEKKELAEFLKELKIFKGQFKRVITLRQESGRIIALHEINKEVFKDNMESFNKDFTKSVVIF